MVIYIILLYIEEYPGLPDRTDAFLLNLYRNRVRNIFECAIDNSVDILVLGAFGCGAFQNPPYQMARAFCEIIRKEKYYSTFSVIAFAIPEDGGKSSQNLRTFKNVFFQSDLQTELQGSLSDNLYITGWTLQDSVELPSGRILKGEELKEYEAWRNNNPYRDKFFSILGDSISTFERTIPDGYCAFYQSEVLEKSGVREAADTWWSHAVRLLGGRVLVDNA